MITMELTEAEARVIRNRRESIQQLWVEYKERLEMYEDGLTHAGDVIARRAFLVSAGETVPEIIFNGYKCPR